MGLDGHLGPAGRMAAVCTGLGHRVVAWAPERFRAALGAAGAELRPVPAPAPDAPLPDVDAVAAGIARVTPQLAEQAAEGLVAERVDLVVHDGMAPWGRVAADWLGLPRICSFAGFPAPAVASELRTGAPGPRDLETLRRSRDEVVRRWGVELGGFADVLVNAGDVTFAYTTPEVAGFEIADPSWRMVGPLMDGGPAPAADPGGPPLVYVGFGTFFSRRTSLFDAPLRALAGEDVRVLAATGGAPVDELGPLPANVTAAEWVDSRAVLAGAAVHVTHGGAGSVHESLLAEVPMVCLPQGADHFHWAARIRELGVGEVVEAPDPAAIRGAVRRLLADPGPRRRLAEIAERLRAHPGARIVEQAVEELLG